MPKPNDEWSLTELKEYIRDHPKIKISVSGSKEKLQTALQNLGHYKGFYINPTIGGKKYLDTLPKGKVAGGKKGSAKPKMEITRQSIMKLFNSADHEAAEDVHIKFKSGPRKGGFYVIYELKNGPDDTLIAHIQDATGGGEDVSGFKFKPNQVSGVQLSEEDQTIKKTLGKAFLPS